MRKIISYTINEAIRPASSITTASNAATGRLSESSVGINAKPSAIYPSPKKHDSKLNIEYPQKTIHMRK